MNLLSTRTTWQRWRGELSGGSGPLAGGGRAVLLVLLLIAFMARRLQKLHWSLVGLITGMSLYQALSDIGNQMANRLTPATDELTQIVHSGTSRGQNCFANGPPALRQAPRTA